MTLEQLVDNYNNQTSQFYKELAGGKAINTIIILPINKFDRSDAENIENSGNLNNKEISILINRGAALLTLEEFTEACNDAVIHLDDIWISYIKYEGKK